MSMIIAHPSILEISPYQPGESRIEGCADVLKLSSNENPLGASPKAVAAYREVAQSLNFYPSSDHKALREAIGKKHALRAERIICGSGSDELISALCQAFSGAGREVIHTRHGFSMYRISALGAGARPVVVEEKERRVDIEAILRALTARTSLVFIANPANPTATMIGRQEIYRLAKGAPRDVLIVLDGAYAEYVDDADYEAGSALVDEFPNIVMLRTFSKFYGLGGLRVGWGYGAGEVIDVLNRIKGPFNLGTGQIAGALGALEDTDFAAHTFETNQRQRARLREGLGALGIKSDPSQANFVLARFENSDAAKLADAQLKSDGIIVRNVANYALPESLRITVGDDAMVTRVLDSLATFVKRQK